MRNLTREQRAEVRMMITLLEPEREVSELEKVMSQLAYLMSLSGIEESGLGDEFKRSAGNADRFDQLLPEQVEEMRALAMRLHVNDARVAFWMWRAWLLQKDFDSAIETDGSGDLRTTLEFFELPEEITSLRDQRVAALAVLHQELTQLLHSLPLAASKANYVLDGLQGSPHGVVSTAIHLLESEVSRLRELRSRIAEEYGFGHNHPPSRRFDKVTRATIKAFVASNRGGQTEESAEGFFDESKGWQHARNNASKAAHRFSTKRIEEFREILLKHEGMDTIPTWFYARRLP